MSWVPRFRRAGPSLNGHPEATIGHLTAKNLSVDAENGITYAYRRFGKVGEGRSPVVFLQHFRGNLENWDPLLVDEIAAEREVILLDNTGVGLSSGQVPRTVTEMARDAIAFLDALELRSVDLLGYSIGGMIVDGEHYRGGSGGAGEIGHMIVKPGGRPCSCGNRGCLEQYASATAIARTGQNLVHARPGNGSGAITARSIAEAAQAGDTESQRIYDGVGEALGIGLASLVSTLNLPLYVVGGGVVAAWDLFAPSMFAEIERGSYIYRLTKPVDRNVPQAGKTNVSPAELGPDSGLLGAAMLPFFQSLDS